METITIEILNPKAKQLIKDLASLNLININKPTKKNSELKAILSKLRSNSSNIPSLEEITTEVESVRAQRYANKTK